MRRDCFWNTLAGAVDASEAVVMSMVATRTSGLSDAGVLTIAFAVGNLLITIGKFGIRGFQVTDRRGQFSFRTYLRSRTATVVLMAIAALGYLYSAAVLKGATRDEWLPVFWITAIYAVEACEDVFWGQAQKKGKLYAGAQMFVLRWIGILLCFALGMLSGGSLKTVLGFCFVLSAFIFCVLCIYRRGLFLEGFRMEGGERGGTVRKLLVETSPLFLVSFGNMYLNNAPKYALSGAVSYERQACYGFVAMPVFVIGLLNNFIYQPAMVPLSEAYGKKDRSVYRRLVKRQFVIIAGLALLCIAGAASVGIPVLSWLYHTDLAGYWKELVLLQVAGGFWAASGYLTALLTVLRCQKSLLAGLVLAGTSELILMEPAARRMGTMGAALAFTGSVLVLFMANLVCYLHYRGKEG